MGSFELAERSRHLLATLIREYIDSGEPVSSQMIAHSSGLGLSSATVRNVLAQLEELGYVHQPHTSAGRVPTDLGYRAFVDMLLESRTPAISHADVEQQLRRRAVQNPLMDDLLAAVSHLVSRAAKHVAFALSADDAAVLKRIEFIPLDGSQVLVVVVARSNQVTQKVVDVGERVRPDDLSHAARYLNTEFAGLPLFEVREAVQERLRQERTLYDQLLARALRLASSTLEHLPNVQTFHVDGAASLLEHGGEGVSTVTLRALFEMMEEKERMIHLLNAYIDGPGLTVVIGTEHTSPDLRRFSLIACTAVDGSTTRTVGVIGPTRMHYSRTIALVDGTTQAVSRVLREAH